MKSYLHTHFFVFRIDATIDDGSLARLVNDDDICPNASMKKVFVDGKPHLALFAIKNISKGQEIRYNYGPTQYTWRQMVYFRCA